MSSAPLAGHSLAVLLFATACGSQPGGTGSPDFDGLLGAQSLPVTNGSPDEGHAAIVSILGEMAQGEPWLLCTGTLVGSRAVLTAAHCLTDVFATPLRVAFGSDARRPTLTLRVIARYVHPEYRSEPLADHDLAVLAIERAAPSEIAPLTNDVPVSDTLVTIVGFGAAWPGESSGQKRVGAARIDELGTTRFRVAPAPALTCFHDSGAPALAELGETRLVGVTTSGRSDCAGFSRFMRADRYWDSFVLPNISLANSLPVPPPEPFARRPRGGCQLHTAGGRVPAPKLATFLGVTLVALRRWRRAPRRRSVTAQ